MKWIKCSERLPDFDTEVLATDGIKYWIAIREQINDVENFIPDIYLLRSNWKNTHWMELPEPPAVFVEDDDNK